VVKKSNRKELAGKLNLNTATEEQLMLLPSVGPSKAERIVVWRKKNGGFKRVADLRRVKGFGYRTFKRLEPFLDIIGRHFKQPKEGLGNDASSVAHMWRTLAMPDNPL